MRETLPRLALLLSCLGATVTHLLIAHIEKARTHPPVVYEDSARDVTAVGRASSGGRSAVVGGYHGGGNSNAGGGSIGGGGGGSIGGVGGGGIGGDERGSAHSSDEEKSGRVANDDVGIGGPQPQTQPTERVKITKEPRAKRKSSTRARKQGVKPTNYDRIMERGRAAGSGGRGDSGDGRGGGSDGGGGGGDERDAPPSASQPPLQQAATTTGGSAEGGHDFTVTLVTQSSPGRFWNVAHICRRWRGPMVVALYVPYTDKQSDFEVAKAGARASAEAATSATACGPNLTVAVVPAKRRAEPYPVNRLRNVAISYAANTSHVFLPGE